MPPGLQKKFVGLPRWAWLAIIAGGVTVGLIIRSRMNAATDEGDTTTPDDSAYTDESAMETADATGGYGIGSPGEAYPYGYGGGYGSGYGQGNGFLPDAVNPDPGTALQPINFYITTAGPKPGAHKHGKPGASDPGHGGQGQHPQSPGGGHGGHGDGHGHDQGGQGHHGHAHGGHGGGNHHQGGGQDSGHHKIATGGGPPQRPAVHTTPPQRRRR